MKDPQEFLKNLSDEQLAEIAQENMTLHETGIIPDGAFRDFVGEVSKKFEEPFNISMAESFLYPEIIKRFIINSNKPK